MRYSNKYMYRSYQIEKYKFIFIVIAKPFVKGFGNSLIIVFKYHKK